MKILFERHFAQIILTIATLTICTLIDANVYAGNAATIFYAPTNSFVTYDNAYGSYPIITAVLSTPGTVNGLTSSVWAFLAQDSSGSIEIYGTNSLNGYFPTVGDAVQVSGTYFSYHEIPEINPSSVILESKGNVVPPPELETVSSLNLVALPQNIAGKLIRVNNVSISSGVNVLSLGDAWGNANLSLTMNDSSGGMVIYYWPTSYPVASSDLFGQTIPAGLVDIIGINSVYTYSSTPEFIPLQIVPASVPAPAPQSPGTTSDTGLTLATLTPALSWSGVAGAAHYGLYISHYPYGSANIVYSNITLTGTSFTLPSSCLQPNTKYRWNMTSFNALGDESAVSSLLYFQTPAASLSPVITMQPLSQTVQVGSNVIMTVAASGQFPLHYQWQFGDQIISGATNVNLSLTNVQISNGGNYSVTISNTYGSTNSATAFLIVYTNLVFTQTNRVPLTNEIGQPIFPTSSYFKVFSNGIFTSGIRLNRNINTVVLTHGWNASPNDWAEYMAQIMQQRIGSTVNIVAWDWSPDAQSDFLHLTQIADKTPIEGYALGTNLVAALGANYTNQIHFVGHSLGTLVNAAAANYIHANGFLWANTQMTLCDEAEIAWGVGANGLWQFATTLPKAVIGLSRNDSTSQPLWGQALPNQFAYADNYISACGLLHSNSANAILTYTEPGIVGDLNTLLGEFYNFHDYAHYFYEDTIEPGIFNNGDRTNATFMGFLCSFEGGGFSSRPATNTYFYQDPYGLELNLVQTNYAFAESNLNARFGNFIETTVSSGVDQVTSNPGEAVGQVTGLLESGAGWVINLTTGIGIGSLVEPSGVHPLGGPVPNGSGSGNTPAYVWVTLTVPPNTLSMSFDFMLQGNGNNDSVQAALGGTNILFLQTILIQTNVTLNSGLIDVSQYSGANVELFFGIVGGTSTNAQLTVSNIQFNNAARPSLQVQVSGNNLILSWPFSSQNFNLQTTTNLADLNLWTTLTNVPVIVNLQNTITNPISGEQNFYRLIK